MRMRAAYLCVLMVCVAVAPASAQSGAVGGSIGKQGKSASGSVDPAPAPAPARPRIAPVPRESTSACGRSPVGSWSSSAGVGTFVMTLNANGTASTDNGFTGRWKCSGGSYLVTWHTGSTSTVSVGADGRTITGTSGAFGVGYSGTRQ